MASLALLVLLAGIAPAMQTTAAAQLSAPQPSPTSPVTIGQLDQILAASARMRDAKLAQQLAALQLTERASPARLARWQAEFKGVRTSQALLSLADRSAFLDPPPPAVPAAAPPDAVTQQQILARASDYVARMRPRLPDFSALRTTTRFEIATPRQMLDQREQIGIASMGRDKLSYHSLGRLGPGRSTATRLYFLGTSAAPVTYANQREIESGEGSLAGPALPRLSTAGEFGPILSVVIGDASRGPVTWGHWEQGATGPVAVFRYSVSSLLSHYAVYYAGSDDPEFPAYHGEIAIDPAGGAILRLVMQSTDPSRPGAESGIVVEYGPVVLGGKSYVCPQRSVALSRLPVPRNTADGGSSLPAAPQTFINDISFTRYHLFRGELRILPEGAPQAVHPPSR